MPSRETVRTWVSSSSCCDNNTVWSAWSQAYTDTILLSTSNSATSNNVWLSWNEGWYDTRGRRVRTWPQAAQMQVQAPPRDDAAIERARIETARIQEQQKFAAERAKKLLIETLTPMQRATWEKDKYFDVRLPNGALFRVRAGISHNVRRLDEQGRERESYCAHPDGVPMEDVLVSQKLMLELTPHEFFKVANRGQDPLGSPYDVRPSLRVPAEGVLAQA